MSGMNRRGFLQAASGAAVAVGLGAVMTPAAQASGLDVVDSDTTDPRMSYYRFRTSQIGWDPAVNVLLPEDYHGGDGRYPVVFLLHGGGLEEDFASFDRDQFIRKVAAGKRIIIVMPDGGHAGWYSNPVNSNTGPRNWETFHIEQLVPWIDANFRTFGGAEGRAVAGFSMGGFGALKYVAKHPELFASVSSHSGPASLRRDAGAVAHWANASSAGADLAGGTIYGVPTWDEAKVSADNPVENVERYRGKRIFLVAGTGPDPAADIQEGRVLAGQREFRALLDEAAIAHEAHEEPGGHVIRPELLAGDLDGMIEHLRQA